MSKDNSNRTELNVTSISYKTLTKLHDFIALDEPVKRSDYVIIEDGHGIEMVRVEIPHKVITANPNDIKKIIRKANATDFHNARINNRDEDVAFEICKRFVIKSELPMKLLSANYSIDRSKLTFMFRSSTRVDFRQLVKELARVFRTRIEMRQVGARDETRELGGIGSCGRELCCHSFIRNFDSSKSLKEGNSSKQSKLLGKCGKVKCCTVFDGKCKNSNCSKNPNTISEQVPEVQPAT